VGRLYEIEDTRLLDHIDRLLVLFDLVDQGDWTISSYSNGQQKKIAIASALVTEAPVLLLDEPFAGGLDPAGTARLYLTVKSRIMDAYRNLGFPEGDFDPVLERAIGVLLATPAIEGAIPLREKVITYQFVDPDIESLPTATKQLLRMGPDNMRIVQAKLREIAVQLGLHPTK
jgi:hypothetical protein